MIPHLCDHVLERMRKRFAILYGPDMADRCLERLVAAIGRYGVGLNGAEPAEKLTASDVVLITYADMVRQDAETPSLQVLHRFLNDRLRGAINTVHLLPFFPWSSDDGFSVIDYRNVADAYGSWDDVREMSRDFSLMFDLVLNHVSRQSKWFQDYGNGIAPARFYFIEVEAGSDLSAVVRPRSSPLLTKVHTKFGSRWVWTTFSDDQIDLDFSQPDVLFEFFDILLLYIAQGARVLRLDAIAYLWKTIGTDCIHRPQAHTIIKLMRDLLDMVSPATRLLTETNVPHRENITYFGDGDEAHMVYQFALPPLLLHAIQTQDAGLLTRWAASLEPLPPGCSYLNFTASHDGIGIRPLQDLVSDRELRSLTKHIQKRGGNVSYKRNPDGTESPYEYNISYFDAVSAVAGGHERQTDRQRFLTSQAVMLALQGVPAVYFHSLFGTRNDTAGVARTGVARSINRRKFQEKELCALLDDHTREEHKVFEGYMHMLGIRIGQPAFAPDAAQEILEVHPACFTLRRTPSDPKQTLVSISNLSAHRLRLGATGALDFLNQHPCWRDLLAERDHPSSSGLKLEAWQTLWLCAGKKDTPR